MSLGPSEILVVLVVALIVLGPDRLPKAAREIGKFMAEFRKFSAGVQDQVSQAMKVPDVEEEKPSETPKPANPNIEGFKPIEGENPVISPASSPIPPPDESTPDGVGASADAPTPESPTPSTTPWRPQTPTAPTDADSRPGE